MPTSDELLDELTTLSHFLGDPVRDLAILGEGNTSGRLDDDTFFVKASGQHLGSITPDGFCACSFSRILPLFNGPTLSDSQVKQALIDCKLDGDSSVMPSV